MGILKNFFFTCSFRVAGGTGDVVIMEVSHYEGNEVIEEEKSEVPDVSDAESRLKDAQEEIKEIRRAMRFVESEIEEVSVERGFVETYIKLFYSVPRDERSREDGKCGYGLSEVVETRKFYADKIDALDVKELALREKIVGMFVCLFFMALVLWCIV